MNTEPQENASLAAKLQELQNELRWIKRLSIAAAVVLAVVILHYHRLGYRSVIAQEFVLTDTLGHERAKLAFLPEGPGLEIYAASGERRVQLVGGGEDATLNLYVPITATSGAASVNLLHNDTMISTFRTDHGAALLEMHSVSGNGAAVLSLRHHAASLNLTGAGEDVPKVSLESEATHACAALAGAPGSTVGGSLCLHSPGLPTLELVDLAGDRAVLGIKQTTDLSKGEPQAGSAASLALEHKSGKSLHLTPQ